MHQMGGGFTSLALTGLLGGEGFINSQAVAADGNTPWANPLAPKNPPLPGQGKERDFSVHVRRAKPHGHLRVQARAVPARRQDD